MWFSNLYYYLINTSTAYFPSLKYRSENRFYHKGENASFRHKFFSVYKAIIFIQHISWENCFKNDYLKTQIPSASHQSPTMNLIEIAFYEGIIFQP